MRSWSYLCFKISVLLIAIIGTTLTTPGEEQPAHRYKWIAPAAEAEKKNPVPANDASVAAGEKIYLKRCVSCHGKTGNGDGPDAVDLGIHPAKLSDPALRDEPDGALFWKITVGRKPMPDYGRRLSPDERWNVIHYLRTFSRK